MAREKSARLQIKILWKFVQMKRMKTLRIITIIHVITTIIVIQFQSKDIILVVIQSNKKIWNSNLIPKNMPQILFLRHNRMA